MPDVASHPTAAVVDRSAQMWQERLIGVVGVTVPGILLGLAANLHADPRGFGTHQQLGLPPCAFYAITGYPCPTCGMTTSFTYAAHGHLLHSAIAQPAGAVLAVFCACAILICGYALIRGLPLSPIAQWLFRPLFVMGMGGLIMVAWFVKIYLVKHGIQ